MKKVILLALLAFTGVIALESFVLRVARKDGTDPGYTGSPGDSLKNCTACHGGTAFPVDGWITSNIPSSGYVPGSTYTITAKNREFGATRFGFEVSPQALSGAMLGTMIITDTGRTQLVGNGKYITYKADGVDGVDSNSWSFDWIAPSAGTGEVVFYGAFNSNYEGSKAGDHTFLSTLKVQENTSVGIATYGSPLSGISVYPNPARDYLDVQIDVSGRCVLDMTDLNGKRVAMLLNEVITAGAVKRISTRDLREGVYFIRLTAEGRTATQKICIGH